MKTIALVMLVLIPGCGGERRPGPAGVVAAAGRGQRAHRARGVSAGEWEAKVLRQGGPVLVDFWAPWCGPCRSMAPAVESLARDFPVYKVNVDEEPELAERYDISAVPTILLFKGGQAVIRHEGVTSQRVLREDMRRLRRR